MDSEVNIKHEAEESMPENEEPPEKAEDYKLVQVSENF